MSINRFVLRMICFIAIISNGAVGSTFNNDIHAMSPGGVNIITQLTNPEQVIYINANSLLEERNQERFNFDSIKNQVLKNKKKYLIDFSSIEDAEDKSLAYFNASKVIGTSFEDDFLVISALNNSLLYSPISGPEDPSLTTVMERENTTLSKTTDKKTENLGSPVLSFYVEITRPISDKECTFKIARVWDDSGELSRVYCHSANISLIYQVEFFRSFAVRHGSQTTPDKKLVRIRLAGNSTGNGIHLNESIQGSYRWEPGGGVGVLDGWVGQYDYDAIALDYKIAISASNKKSKVLYKYPNSNVQSNYEHREVAGFNIGGTTGGDISGDGPKGKLEVTGNYSSTNWLTYPTTDYAIKLSTPDDKTFIVIWDREQYRDLSTLRTEHTLNAVGQEPPENILDRGKLKPIGHSNFTPQMEVFYAANPSETGTTIFNIDTSVLFSPMVFGVYQHYAVWVWFSFQGLDYTPRRIHATRSFKVNWEHPVFTGANPVNLQLGALPNTCIATNDNHDVLLEECNGKNLHQSFIYDELGRYVSATNTSMCLDAANLRMLANCTMSLSQRWNWIPNTNKLENEYFQQPLSFNDSDSSLHLSSDPNSRVFTSYTDIYQTNHNTFCKIHEWDNSLVAQVGNIYLYKNPYTNTNDYFRLKKEFYWHFPNWHFPIDQTSNTVWEFLGHTYCDQLIEID